MRLGVDPVLARGPDPVNLRRDVRAFQQRRFRPCYLAGIDRSPERTVKHTILWRRLDVPGHDACQLVALDDGWRLSGMAVFNLDGRPCALGYEVDADARWSSRGARVRGSWGTERVDVTILAAPGGTADVPVAWLAFPELTLERLEQRYRRLAQDTYDYQAPGVPYEAHLKVNELGFVTLYPGLWEVEAR
ncbi:MAG: hypothetical protein DMD77_07900 [Candidatus Rokuibacteriota bacterium]|nr:MAG: hypothetical protein DMD77_07900 [Candidatus Rokubacteria bacterium]